MKNVLRVEDGAIISPGGGGGGSSVTYSTTEQEVGTWIDGKTIYRKTWTGLSLVTSTSWAATSIDISDCDTIVNGFSIDNNGQSISQWYGKSGGVLYLLTAFAGQTIATITLEYTKGA